jgi:DNA-binding transcriptional regulator GbsR (MarR family)
MPTCQDEQLARFIERLAANLAAAGVPRLASRVWAALMVSDSGRMTAADLADCLQASSGGISGAVGYLVQVGLIRREREPGTRRDTFVVDGSWYERTVSSSAFLTAGASVMREGLTVVGENSPAADRLRESLDLIEFLTEETRAMMLRWEERKASLRDARSSTRNSL